MAESDGNNLSSRERNLLNLQSENKGGDKLSLIEDILEDMEAGKEDCYNCENLTKFSKKELKESIAQWERAKAKGYFKNLADTTPYVARCKIQGLMTELAISRLHNNCKEVCIKI